MKSLLTSVALLAALPAAAQVQSFGQVPNLQCQAIDVSADFADLAHTYFLADSLSGFDTASGVGSVRWKRYRLAPRQAFNLNGTWPVRLRMLDFPDAAYDNDPDLKLQLRFVSPRTVRITMLTTPVEQKEDDASDPMFVSAPKNDMSQWKAAETANAVTYTSPYGQIEIQKSPWRIVVKNANGKILTQTRHIADNDSSQVKLMPFCFIKRGSDNSRSINPVLRLARRFLVAARVSPSLTRLGRRCI